MVATETTKKYVLHSPILSGNTLIGISIYQVHRHKMTKCPGYLQILYFFFLSCRLHLGYLLSHYFFNSKLLEVFVLCLSNFLQWIAESIGYYDRGRHPSLLCLWTWQWPRDNWAREGGKWWWHFWLVCRTLCLGRLVTWMLFVKCCKKAMERSPHGIKFLSMHCARLLETLLVIK